MFEKLGLTRMAQALAAHSGARLSTIAANVANADTPGFRAHDLRPFAQIYSDHPSFQARATRIGHLLPSGSRPEFEALPTGGAMSPNGNDVSLDLQMLMSVEARQSHEMALAIYRSTSSIIRTSLGRFS